MPDLSTAVDIGLSGEHGMTVQYRPRGNWLRGVDARRDRASLDHLPVRCPPRWTLGGLNSSFGQTLDQSYWIKLVLTLAQGDTVEIRSKVPDAFSKLQYYEDRA